MKTEATGLYSRKAFERLGFRVASEFLYTEYLVRYTCLLAKYCVLAQDTAGDQVFAGIKNHRGTAFMIKQLPHAGQQVPTAS